MLCIVIFLAARARRQGSRQLPHRPKAELPVDGAEGKGQIPLGQSAARLRFRIQQDAVALPLGPPPFRRLTGLLL